MSALFLVFSYIVGSFPTGKLIAKLHNVEIEKLGSGNVGATNIARTLGKKAGILTLVGDAAKGFIVVALALYTDFDPINGISIESLASIAVVLGHCFSLPGLRGGKGVATALGVILGLSLPLALASVLIFILVVYTSRLVSAASLSAALGAPIIALLLYADKDFPLALAVIGLIITYRHKENIQRLIEGREPRFN